MECDFEIMLCHVPPDVHYVINWVSKVYGQNNPNKNDQQDRKTLTRLNKEFLKIISL